MTHTLPSEHTAQFVLETDAPYLSPQTKRGTMNVPAHIPDLYTAIAKELQVSVEKLQTMTREAMQALYTIS